MSTYAFPSLVTALTLVVYLAITLNVGRARFKYKVKPPAMTGEPEFERVLRVQQNTLEQLVLFLPALWLFSVYVSPVWGSGIGAVWMLGRITYAWGYYQAAEKRGLGFGVSVLAVLTLLIGGLIGIVRSLVSG